MQTINEQKLIAFAFEVGVKSARYNGQKSNEEIVRWVQEGLNSAGLNGGQNGPGFNSQTRQV